MGFLSGRVSFERFRVGGSAPNQFDQEHIDILQSYAIGEIEADSAEAPSVGFLAGNHLFDVNFDLSKNVIVDALHAALRIDTARVPGPLKKAWLEMELAARLAESPTGRLNKAQRQEAKDAVQARCDAEIRRGQFKRMTAIPFLWNLSQQIVYCGTSNVAAQDQLKGLLENAFDIELTRLTAGGIAGEIATEQGWTKGLDKVTPSAFGLAEATGYVAWLSGNPDSVDYLGNEFLVWLWWYLEAESDEISLLDETSVTVMLSKTLTLECPLGESGRETISAEGPTQLPEALCGLRSGKLPRKIGMVLSRGGEQYEFVLQAESLALGGAAIQLDGEGRGRGAIEERVAGLRRLSETLDLLYAAFLKRRLGRQWGQDLAAIQSWLESEAGEEIRKAG